MTKYYKIILSAVLLAACTARAVDDSATVLWWMFDEATEIEEIGGGSTTIDQLTGRGEAEGKTVNGIRIAAYNGDALLGYLAIADGFGGTGEYYEMPSLVKVGGTWTDTWNAGPTYAELGVYATTPGVSFMIELGNWDANAAPGSEWQVLAHSDPGTMSSLDEFMHSRDFDQHTTLEWTGGQYVVPEPSSGLLLLIGGALLALRRRRGD